VRCSGGTTRPLDIETVIEVGRRHEITLYSDPECSNPPGIVSQASNTILYGSDANTDRYDEITRQEGDVRCGLYSRSRGDAKVHRLHYADDVETRFTLHNVRCVIYPDEDHAKEQLRHLQEAMNELEQRAS